MEAWLSHKKNNIISHSRVLGFTDCANGPADGAIGWKETEELPSY